MAQHTPRGKDTGRLTPWRTEPVVIHVKRCTSAYQAQKRRMKSVMDEIRRRTIIDTYSYSTNNLYPPPPLFLFHSTLAWLETPQNGFPAPPGRSVCGPTFPTLWGSNELHGVLHISTVP